MTSPSQLIRSNVVEVVYADEAVSVRRDDRSRVQTKHIDVSEGNEIAWKLPVT